MPELTLEERLQQLAERHATAGSRSRARVAYKSRLAASGISVVSTVGGVALFTLAARAQEPVTTEPTTEEAVLAAGLAADKVALPATKATPTTTLAEATTTTVLESTTTTTPADLAIAGKELFSPDKSATPAKPKTSTPKPPVKGADSGKYQTPEKSTKPAPPAQKDPAKPTQDKPAEDKVPPTTKAPTETTLPAPTTTLPPQPTTTAPTTTIPPTTTTTTLASGS